MDVFLGTGNNPDGPELPLGFGMELPQHPKALESYTRMSQAEREALIRYIQDSQTGEDAKRRINETIKQLEDSAR